MQELTRKVEAFLGEFRIIVPALGALFGFQLVVSFQDSFPGLDYAPRVANFLAMLSTALALVFLIVPASYHRFTDELDTSVRFVRFAQRMVSIAFVFIPVSLCLSVYVQAIRTFDSQAVAVPVALGLLAACGLFWWVVPMARAKTVEQA